MILTPGIREKRILLLERLAKKRRSASDRHCQDGSTSSLTSSDFCGYGQREEDGSSEDDSSDPNRTSRSAFNGPRLEELPLPSSARRPNSGPSSQHVLTTPSPMQPPQRHSTNNSGLQHSTRSGTSVSIASTSGSASSGAQPPPSVSQLPAPTHLFPIDGSGISKSLFTSSTNNLLDLVELLGFKLGETRKRASKPLLQLFLIRLYGDPSILLFDDKDGGRGWQTCTGADDLSLLPANRAMFEEAFPVLATLSASISPPTAPPAEEENLESPLALGSAEPLADPLVT